MRWGRSVEGEGCKSSDYGGRDGAGEDGCVVERGAWVTASRHLSESSGKARINTVSDMRCGLRDARLVSR